MTSTTLAGRTEWETAEYRRDHGQRAAVALAYRLLADFLRSDTAGPLPPPGTVYLPVTRGSEDQREAAVDAWAQAHHITAGWAEDRHHYFAKLSFGPVSLMVYMIPDPAEVPVIGSSSKSGVAAA